MLAITQDWKPHKSHKLGKSVATVWAPAGTPRFYAVRTCKKCGGEVGRHPAGQFADEALFSSCIGK